jgi:hypothetical protein
MGENHFLADSLTWRELFIGLTTYLFNHDPDSLLLQPVSTQFLLRTKYQYSIENPEKKYSTP